MPACLRTLLGSNVELKVIFFYFVLQQGAPKPTLAQLPSCWFNFPVLSVLYRPLSSAPFSFAIMYQRTLGRKIHLWCKINISRFVARIVGYLPKFWGNNKILAQTTVCGRKNNILECLWFFKGDNYFLELYFAAII